MKRNRTPRVVRQAERAARKPLTRVMRQKILIIAAIVLLILTFLAVYAFTIYQVHHG